MALEEIQMALEELYKAIYISCTVDTRCLQMSCRVAVDGYLMGCKGVERSCRSVEGCREAVEGYTKAVDRSRGAVQMALQYVLLTQADGVFKK